MQGLRPRVQVDIPDQEFRWALRHAAAEHHQSIATLVTSVLSPWLIENGFLPGKTDRNVHGGEAEEKETLARPIQNRPSNSHIAGITPDPERAEIIVAIETGTGDLATLRLTPRQCMDLKCDLYNAIEVNKHAQTNIETCLAELEGDDERERRGVD